MCLFLLLGLGLSLAPAANLLTNPGFEEGQTGWSDVVRGGSAVVITDAAIAHGGSSCISNFNAGGWSSANQGDSQSIYSTGVSLPVSDANFYQLSAWVKVPGAATTPQQITLRYRFEPSGNRVDVGTQTISTEDWTLIQSPWLKSAVGDFYMSYWEVHSLSSAIAFYADDCALEESVPLTLQGRVVDGGGAGLDGATVSATSTGWVPAGTTTAGGGYYSFSVPAGTYTVSAAKALYSSGSTSVTLTTGSATAPNITLTALPTAVVSGKVLKTVGGSPVGVAGAVVSASYASGPASVSAPSATDGSYSVQVLVGSQVILSATASGLLPVAAPAAFTAPNTSPITGKDIQVADVPAASSLLFSVVTESLPASGPAGNWPTFLPAGLAFAPIGAPTVQQFGGVKWERNYYATSTGFQLQDPALAPSYAYTAPIPVDGATIVLAAKPVRNVVGLPWDSIVDIFYGQLCLGVMNDNGRIVVKVGDTVDSNSTYVAPAETAIPDGQTTIISLVVSNTGTFVVYTNGSPIWTNTATLGGGLGFTSLTPGVNGTYANYINIGRNQPDGWPVFNGYIGDVFVYTSALADVDRQSLEASLQSWFVTNATLSYTITASAGANGSISPAGAVSVLQGTDKTFTMTASSGFVVSEVLVDGTSVGAVTSYTFTNVSATHTIAASFAALPPQTITASAGANGTISPSGAVSVEAGANQTFAILPNYGYAVSNVVVDGVSQGEIGSYTFSFVTAPHTISVTFRALDMAIPRADQILFSVVGNALLGDSNPTGPWPTYVPTNKTLAAIGAPTSVVGIDTVGTNIWESNVYATGDGYRWPTVYNAPIPCTGVSIAAVVAPTYVGAGGEPRGEIVDLFYSELFLAVSHAPANEGEVIVDWRGYNTMNTGYIIPDRKPTLLCLVVQPNGDMTLYADSAKVWTQSTGVDYTSLQQTGLGGNARTICVGRNDYDGWSTFSGNIGDVFLYTTALSDADRKQLEAVEMSKYSIPLPPTYEWAGPNNGNWSAAANWITSVPEAGKIAVFSHTNTAGATVQLDTAVSVKGLEFNNQVPNTTIASTAGNTLTLDDGTTTGLAPLMTDAGSHTISAGLSATVGLNKTGPGTMTLSGTVDVGAGGTVNPALVVSGTGSELVIAGNTTMVDPHQTSVNGGGKLTVTGSYTSGGSDQLTDTGEIILRGNGLWTVTATGGYGWVGIGSSGNGVLTVQDTAKLDCPSLNIGLWGASTTSTVNQNGGTVYVHSTDDQLVGWGGPEMTVGPWYNTPTASGEYHLNGGVLNCGFIAYQGGPGAGSGVFYFNGGKLVINRDDPNDTLSTAVGQTAYMQKLTRVNIQAGGAIIDTDGHISSIDQKLEHDASAPAIDGGLTKMGAGTLKLLRASTYTGPTKVQVGVLACETNSAVGTGALDISTGAKLELNYVGTAPVSQLTFNGGAAQPTGTYGATGSGAAHIDDTHFVGTGSVTVQVPAPPPPDLPASSFSIVGGVPTFTDVATTAGYTYWLVYKNSLTNSTWTRIGTGTAGGGNKTFTDTTQPPAVPERFYRLQVQ